VRRLEQLIGTVCRKTARKVAEFVPPPSAQEAGPSASPQDDNAKVPQDDNAKVPQDDNAKVAQDHNAKVAQDDNAKVAQDDNAKRTMPKLIVTPERVHEYLGGIKVRVDTEIAERTKRPGVAVGLAWTPAGGDVLFIEANRMKGKGGFTITGQIGDVMKESMQAALTWVRSNAASLGLDEDVLKDIDLHIHVPAGAIPKDGPSAGVTMATALVSLLTDRPVRPLLAMTGEITLSGHVLPVGGIKEKFLAAKRAGVRDVILPIDVKSNVEEDLTADQTEGVTIHYATRIEDVLEVALPKTLSEAVEAEELREEVLAAAE
jgi:ATP-dependent Lon protease